MIKVTRQTGPCKGKRIHLTCPKCGYNVKRSSQVFYEEKEREDFKSLKDMKNNNELNIYLKEE